jgi:hypothetical protein
MKAAFASFLVCCSLPVPCIAEIVTRSLQAEVRSVRTSNGPSGPESLLPPGHRFNLTVQYTTELPEGAPHGELLGHTGRYWMIGDWTIEDGAALGLAVGFGTIGFTNDHPSWDAVRFTADQTQTFGLFGPALLTGATVVLSDATRTALKSTDLASLPDLAAFSAGEFALSFHDYFGDVADPTPRTIVLGRIVSIDRYPDRPVYQCKGFGAPLQKPLRIVRGDSRFLPLRANLLDAQRRPVGARLLSRPILRVLQTDGRLASQRGMSFLELDGEDGSLVLRGGQWQYSLRGDAFPEAGNYLVYVASPDQNEYVIDPQCVLEVQVADRPA